MGSLEDVLDLEINIVNAMNAEHYHDNQPSVHIVYSIVVGKH